jgi:hypothetical protein
VYSAKIDGRKSGVTVAMYQGEGAEEVSSLVLSWSKSSNEARRNGAKILRIIWKFGKFRAKPSLLSV